MDDQSCDMMACEYGIKRYFTGQNSMLTNLEGTKFKDEYFPPATSSLYWEKFTKDQSDAMQVFQKNVKKWARPTDMYPRRAPSLWGS